MMRFSNETIPVRPENRPQRVDCHAFRMDETVYVRDPFILPYDGRYYLYHNDDRKIKCWVSEDLEWWSENVTVFDPPEGFHGVDHLFWAPECHWFEGYFYIFTSVLSTDGHHHVSAYRATNPLGPFEDIAGGCLLSRDYSTIDGTLYVDEAGDPWLIYVHEWIDMPDRNGLMDAVRLSRDFTHTIGEPVTLFRASDLPEGWGVTDGPFLWRTESGALRMIWSNFTNADHYLVTMAGADNLLGPWEQKGILYHKDEKHRFDGGHGMIFKTFDGRTLLAIHAPNGMTDGVHEHLELYPIAEENGELVLKD